MIRFSVGNGVSRETVNASSEDTVRQVIENSGLEMGSGVIHVDGQPLNVNQLDRPVSELNLNDTIVHSMTAVEKLNCAAKALLVGSVAIIESRFTPDELELVQKQRPSTLILKDEEKNIVYEIRKVKGAKGAINQFGAEFGTATNAEGKATITIDVPEGKDKEWFIDNYAGALSAVNKIENCVAESYADILQERQNLADSIEVR